MTGKWGTGLRIRHMQAGTGWNADGLSAEAGPVRLFPGGCGGERSRRSGAPGAVSEA